ncbi:MAG: immune inhibitor A domain-containing protein [bacterium]
MILLILHWPLPADSDPSSRLHELRADRRSVMRRAAAQAVADSLPTRFGLLVIPVDFADLRLPVNWEQNRDLGSRLFPLTGESLANYYRLASRNHLELSLFLTPPVHLAGNRADYATVPRSRLLAAEALQLVAASGLDFRLLDMEGPDRLPGSDDDDGQVDGVLLLHAGIGTENDLVNGQIIALQYFLEQPVMDRGVAASLYAVASMQSGVGIWAHEVAHLIGLEDRYDPDLAVGLDDPRSRGGLGRFSLMSAGAWGSGEGHGAALLDAYSAAQLGWYSVVNKRGNPAGVDTLSPGLTTGETWRIWSHGRTEAEYFLLETRGDPDAAPFDADIPPGQLLVYHVDETLPEGLASSVSPEDRHLRVALLEADGDDRLRTGQDVGRPEDQFPGPLGVAELTPTSSPASWGYQEITEVSLTAITSLPVGVAFELQDATAFGVEIEFGFTDADPPQLTLAVRETGLQLPTLSATVTAVSTPSWGEFAGSGLEREMDLQRDASGSWTPGQTSTWQLNPGVIPGAETRFTIVCRSGDWQSQTAARNWIWRAEENALDFATSWPESWEQTYPGDNLETSWTVWSDEPTLTADGSPVLICTGVEFTSSTSWPDVSYHNFADAVLQSAPLPTGTAAVRIVHAMDGEQVRPGVAWDAGLVEFVLPDGSVVGGYPLDGYDGIVDPSTRSDLHGRPAFVGDDSLQVSGPIAWRVDVVPTPASNVPVRLRLRFASDPIFPTGVGWLLARLEPLATFPDASAFSIAWLSRQDIGPPHLAWNWFGETATEFAIQSSENGGSSWRTIWAGQPSGDIGEFAWGVPLSTFEGSLEGSVSSRTLFRVLAAVPYGRVASRPVAYYRDGGAKPSLLLAEPYPNPAHSEVHLLLEVPRGKNGRLLLFDPRGRLLRRWQIAGGNQLLVWDGRDGARRRVAAGVYLFRMEAAGRTASRKVVFLP